MNELHTAMLYEIETLGIADELVVHRRGFVRLEEGELLRWLAAPTPKLNLRVCGVRVGADGQPQGLVTQFAGDQLWPAHIAASYGDQSPRHDARLRFWRWLPELSEAAIRLYLSILADDEVTARRAEALECFARFDVDLAKLAVQSALFSRLPGLAPHISLTRADHDGPDWPGALWPTHEGSGPKERSTSPMSSNPDYLETDEDRVVTWLSLVAGWRTAPDSARVDAGAWAEMNREVQQRWKRLISDPWWVRADTPPLHPTPLLVMHSISAALIPPTWWPASVTRPDRRRLEQLVKMLRPDLDAPPHWTPENIS